MFGHAGLGCVFVMVLEYWILCVFRGFCEFWGAAVVLLGILAFLVEIGLLVRDLGVVLF